MRSSVVHHVFLPQGRTLNKKYYLEVMRRLRETIRQEHKKLGQNLSWILPPDNALAHTLLLVREFLAEDKP